MITIFNRAKLISAFSMEKEAKIRAALTEAGIPFQVKVQGGATQGAETGTFGVNMNAMYEYIFYVYKKDVSKADRALKEWGN